MLSAKNPLTSVIIHQTLENEINFKSFRYLMAVDQNLSELLTEYRNLAESDQENQNFIGSIINKTDNAAIIFGALSQFEVNKLIR